MAILATEPRRRHITNAILSRYYGLSVDGCGSGPGISPHSGNSHRDNQMDMREAPVSTTLIRLCGISLSLQRKVHRRVLSARKALKGINPRTHSYECR